jgi:hypothetical protein
MNVFRWAVQKGAVKVVFVQNHPSGDLQPSTEDLDLTDRLIQVGRILNIEAIDHVIISTNTFFSYVDANIFEKWKESTKWVPQFELIKRIQEEEKKIREQEVRQVEVRGELQKLLELKKAEDRRLKELKLAEDKRMKEQKQAEIQLKKAEDKRLKELKQAESKNLKELKQAEAKRLSDLKMRNLEVAKKLKQRNLPLKEIMAISGLTKAEIEKIK